MVTAGRKRLIVVTVFASGTLMYSTVQSPVLYFIPHGFFCLSLMNFHYFSQTMSKHTGPPPCEAASIMLRYGCGPRWLGDTNYHSTNGSIKEDLASSLSRMSSCTGGLATTGSCSLSFSSPRLSFNFFFKSEICVFFQKTDFVSGLLHCLHWEESLQGSKPGWEEKADRSTHCEPLPAFPTPGTGRALT